jgi:hypothetical protein
MNASPSSPSGPLSTDIVARTVTLLRRQQAIQTEVTEGIRTIRFALDDLAAAAEQGRLVRAELAALLDRLVGTTTGGTR